MHRYALITILSAACFMAACSDDSGSLCGNGVIDPGEECDTLNMNGSTCESINPGTHGKLTCTSACRFETSSCTVPECNHNGIKDAGELCDGSDLGGATCATADKNKPYGQLGCTENCTYYTRFCAASDLGLQAPMPDAEQTDALCINGINDFKTVDKNGNISKWFDCSNHACVTSPLVQVCHATENTNALCSDSIDNATASNLPSGMGNVQNGLIDCQDPSCFKNWRISVCDKEAPRWELGAECSDGKDNDGDGLADCLDPDCLHAGASECPLEGRMRVLFDNAHHQIAGTVDWIIDVTGRHPFPSMPKQENDWHGSLSSFGKDLIDTGHFIPETLPQDRTLAYQSASPQDLTQYGILVLVEPSAKFSDEEISAVASFVQNGGRVLYFADHKGSDRDGNNVDSVDALNDMLAKFPTASSKTDNPLGFYALDNSSMSTDTAIPTADAPDALLNGVHGKVAKTGSYAGTAFKIFNSDKASQWMTTTNGAQAYVVAATFGKGIFAAIGDSSIAGDGTNFLGISSSKAAYRDTSLDNRAFLLNMMEYLYSR